MQNAKFRTMQYAKNFELESEKMQLKPRIYMQSISTRFRINSNTHKPQP